MTANVKIKAPLTHDAPDVVALVGVFLFAVLLPHIPILNWVTWPLEELNTLIHEMGHAVACLLFGGSVNGMTIVPDGVGHGGLTYTKGGIPWITSQGGYLGTTIVGCALIALARIPRASKIALGVIGVAFGLASVTFMFNGVMGGADRFQALGSMVVGLCLAAALLSFAFKLSVKWANMLLLFLGVQMGMNAIDAIWYLVQVSMGLGNRGWSDATNMAQMTGVPAFVWALFWGALSVWMLMMTISWTYDPDYGKRAKRT